ncbi:5933_t:CDS:10 [Funneliformis mosseae]|uniref:ATP-dependent RNA helicase DRS1 n=1 Tax=Funneliformis mosseae TaxID=27381 RepID=A0A9N8WFW8_FUNMO|nr:5933_t:CDS:10 [Funneliformis mosseae]
MDDFVLTIEDDTEVIIPEEESSDVNDNPQTSSSNNKKLNKKGDNKKEKKTKKEKDKKEINKKDVNTENDIINPDFTFFIDGINNSIEHPWDFSAARAGLKPKILVTSRTIDEIIEKKRLDTKKEKNAKANGNNKNGNKKVITKSKHDEDDPFAFGGGVDYVIDDEEGISDSEQEEENNEHKEKQDANSEDDMNDEGIDEDDDEDDVDEDDTVSSETDDEYERERKKAYFADKSEIIQNQDLASTESFQTMNLSRPILKGLSHLGFIQPTPIQKQAIPIALMGKDICGGAITGSGKTIAFLVPIIERLLYRPRQTAEVRVLILAPTRELAIQCHSVASKLAAFTDITLCLCVGGLSLKKQETELRVRPDIVIATPGRLIDHVRNSVSFSLENIEILIIDEADRMLEDGFADELNEIVKHCPKSRQTMLFSATMTDNIDELIRLSLNRPVKLMVDHIKATNAKLIQEFIRIREHQEKNRELILLILCKKYFKHKVIIFFRSKMIAHEMKIIFGLFGLKASELHGNLSQEQRLEALEAFRDGKVDYLLATDLASRGLDIKGIETVINYNMPQSYDHYIHRVGRTARAGRNGRSVTLTGEEDRKLLKMVLKHSQKEQIKRRNIDTELIKEYAENLAGIKDKVKEVLKEEKEEKLIKQTEMELLKGQNLIKYKEEIVNRPARTWFQTEKEKKSSKNLSVEEYNEKFDVKKRRRDEDDEGGKKKIKRDKYAADVTKKNAFTVVPKKKGVEKEKSKVGNVIKKKVKSGGYKSILIM